MKLMKTYIHIFLVIFLSYFTISTFLFLVSDSFEAQGFITQEQTAFLFILGLILDSVFIFLLYKDIKAIYKHKRNHLV